MNSVFIREMAVPWNWEHEAKNIINSLFIFGS